MSQSSAHVSSGAPTNARCRAQNAREPITVRRLGENALAKHSAFHFADGATNKLKILAPQRRPTMYFYTCSTDGVSIV